MSTAASAQEVESQLMAVQLQVKLTAGPKKLALEHLRKKIEAQNEKLSGLRCAAASRCSHCNSSCVSLRGYHAAGLR